MTLDELITPLTVAQARAAIYAAIEARGASTTAWKPGSVVRTMISGLAIVLAAFSTLQALIAKSGFLSLAEKDWLTLVARHVYGVERNLGTFASGSVTLTNTAGGVFSGAAGDVVVTNMVTGKTYRNTAAYSLGAAPASIAMAIQALELGTPSTSAAGEINAFVTTLTGVTVTNPAAVVGTDAETDAALRLRCAAKLGSLSPNGPWDAYLYVARSALGPDGVTNAGVTRVRTTADGFGGLAVRVASAAGVVTGTVGDLGTNLGCVNRDIQLKAVPLAVTATVSSATALVIDVTYELWIRSTSGLTEDQIKALIAAALLAHITESPIGGNVISPATGKIYVSALAAIIGDAVPNTVVKVIVTLPAADVAVTASQAPMLGTILVTGIRIVVAGVL